MHDVIVVTVDCCTISLAGWFLYQWAGMGQKGERLLSPPATRVRVRVRVKLVITPYSSMEENINSPPLIDNNQLTDILPGYLSLLL